MKQTLTPKPVVPEVVIQHAAKKCHYAFSCLETGKCGDRELCAVEYTTLNGLVFLQDRQYQSCPCRLGFGDRQMCLCPMRVFMLTGSTQNYAQ